MGLHLPTCVVGSDPEPSSSGTRWVRSSSSRPQGLQEPPPLQQGAFLHLQCPSRLCRGGWKRPHQLPRRAHEHPWASAGAAHYLHHWEAGHLAGRDSEGGSWGRHCLRPARRHSSCLLYPWRAGGGGGQGLGSFLPCLVCSWAGEVLPCRCFPCTYFVHSFIQQTRAE